MIGDRHGWHAILDRKLDHPVNPAGSVQQTVLRVVV
jgi:hypothetical protein